MPGPRAYRNRRDVRKAPASRPLFQMPVIIGSTIDDFGDATPHVTFDAQMVRQDNGEPLVIWKLSNLGIITVYTTGVLDADGLGATFTLPGAPLSTDWLLFPGNQQSLLSGQNWQAGMAVQFCGEA